MNDTTIENAEIHKRGKPQKRVLTLSPELWEFMNSAVPSREIAARYGISPATLTVRAKRAGLPLRKRGRWPLTAPTPDQKKILAFAAIQGCQRAASLFGLSKQRVNKLQHRWKSWLTSNPDLKTKIINGCKINQHIVRFPLKPASFHQLRKLLQHPLFHQLESVNQIAGEIVESFLASKKPSLKSERAVNH
jgi:hypothetical protein